MLMRFAMPIKKLTGSELHKRGLNYTSISNAVVESIANPVALAIYCYLITKPHGWIVRRTDILNHFESLGLDRYSKAMRELKTAGLLVDEYIHEEGRMRGRRLVLLGYPEDSDNSTSGNPIIQTIDPPSNKVSTTVVTDNRNKELFEEFWRGYPRKSAKGDALKAFKSLPTEDQEQAIKCLASFVFNDDLKYIPYPASWLRSKRWLDEQDVQETRRAY